MIQLQITAIGDKIKTNYNEKEPILSENSLLVRELERIKQNLVETNFDIESEIKVEEFVDAEDDYDDEDDGEGEEE